jgi:hypothetical protein
MENEPIEMLMGQKPVTGHKAQGEAGRWKREDGSKNCRKFQATGCKVKHRDGRGKMGAEEKKTRNSNRECAIFKP